MNFSFFVAKKYFWSGKKKKFINVISIISMFLVMLGTAALIIVLSVLRLVILDGVHQNTCTSSGLTSIKKMNNTFMSIEALDFLAFLVV